MDHPSIMKLLEDDEDESMHSGADVEALSAALNRDIGGDSSTFSQPSESEPVGVLPQASSSASQQLLEQWQTSNQNENITQNIQVKEDQPHSQPSDQLSSQIGSTQQFGVGDQDQQSSSQPKHDQPQLKQEQLLTETNAPQSVDKDQVKTSEQSSFQLPKQGSSTAHSENQQQHTHQQLNIQEQTAAANEANNSAKKMRASPSIPFQLLIPIIRPHLDKDRSMQLQAVFTKLRTNEVSKEDFLRVIRNIVGDQMLRQAVNKVHMQLQAQAAKNQQNPTQYSLQTQASPQQLLSHGTQMFPEPRAFSSLNSISSSQNQKGQRSPPRQPVSASTIQMQMDAMFPPVENSGQKSREIENNSDGRVMQSANKNAVISEREASMNSFPAVNKQQQLSHRPQTPFSMYGGNSGNFSSHPFGRPPISATAPLRSHPQDSQMRQAHHAQSTVSTQMGSTQPSNVINLPKYEPQNISSEAKRLHGVPLAGPSTPQQRPISWQTMGNKEQRSTSLSSMPYVKQEVVEHVSESSHKSQLTTLDRSSFGAGHIDQGNPTLVSLNDGIETQPSRMAFPTSLNSLGSRGNPADSAMQLSSPPVSGTTTKAPPKKPSVGQKKPLEAVTNSSAIASKKQKTSGVSRDQSIEHLNDVTAVSGVNLEEEEEQLLSAPKEDSHASEATRRVVQEEEERLIIQKGPLQKKLADIMFKCGLKRISSDVERCLSLCIEERLRGLISSTIRLSKHRVDAEKARHPVVITSDFRPQILTINRKAKEECDKKQAEEAEKLRKVNDAEGSNGSDADKDKDEGRSKTNKVNKEEDDKMRATAANVAARAAVGGDDMLSKWQLMAEQARQKREGVDGASSSQSGKANKHSPGFKRNSKEQQESQKRGGFTSSLSGANRKFGRSTAMVAQPKVTHNITRKDLIAVLEREPQMSKSTLLYRLLEKVPSDPAVA